jgi:excinuclease ABC subunit A
VVIEHNLDVIAEADWIVDLGPEGGSSGGRVVFQGAPEKCAEMSPALSSQGDSHTCRALAEFLSQRGNSAPPGMSKRA